MPSTKRIGFKINAENGYTYTVLLNASTSQSIVKLNDYYTPQHVYCMPTRTHTEAYIHKGK